MTLEEAQAVVGSITYKSGWEFRSRIDESVYDSTFRLEISLWTPDSNGKILNDIQVHRIASLVWPEIKHMDEDDFRRWVRFEIRATEDHEINEFLRFNGIRHSEPHPDENPNGV